MKTVDTGNAESNTNKKHYKWSLTANSSIRLLDLWKSYLNIQTQLKVNSFTRNEVLSTYDGLDSAFKQRWLFLD